MPALETINVDFVIDQMIDAFQFCDHIKQLQWAQQDHRAVALYKVLKYFPRDQRVSLLHVINSSNCPDVVIDKYFDSDRSLLHRATIKLEKRFETFFTEGRNLHDRAEWVELQNSVVTEKQVDHLKLPFFLCRYICCIDLKQDLIITLV